MAVLQVSVTNFRFPANHVSIQIHDSPIGYFGFINSLVENVTSYSLLLEEATTKMNFDTGSLVNRQALSNLKLSKNTGMNFKNDGFAGMTNLKTLHITC